MTNNKAASPREELARAIADGFTNGNEQYDEATEPQQHRYDMAAYAAIAALLKVAIPKPSEADQFAQDAKCSEAPDGQEYETALRIPTDMDAENMPIEKRAAILGSMIARPNDADRAWAAEMAKGLPEAPAMGWEITEAMRDAFYEATEITREGSILNFDAGVLAMLAASTPESALQPALGEREIDDEMIKRGVRAINEDGNVDLGLVDADLMRKALTAALSTTTSTKGVE